ncbi:MAG: YfiR family protein [Campylobacterales bacterium]|nr:YfiR family protein [Campylobacterales bacterium]
MFINLKKIFILIIVFQNILLFSNPIKLSIVKKISQFVQWPNDFNEEFLIAVYMNNKLKNEMINLYKNKTIHKKLVKVINIKNIDDKRIKDINLFYFTKELENKGKEILFKLKKNNTLIISDFKNDIYLGMHLVLYYENKRIKFLINTKALDDSNLKASYKILKLAKLLKDENE